MLEIGFGTGLNLPCYPPHVRKVTAADPNAGMVARARTRIEQTGIEVVPAIVGGEELPFADAAFDTVVSTFTLCSIDAVEQAIAQVGRVLRPGGRFLFLEHGLSPRPRVRKWQRRLNWLERLMCGGCRLDRDIPALVSGGPFRSFEFAEGDLERVPPTHGHLYRGVAAK